MMKKIFRINWFAIKLPFKISIVYYILYWVFKLLSSIIPIVNVYIFKLIIDELLAIYNNVNSDYNRTIWILIAVYIILILFNGLLTNLSTYVKSILKDKTQLYIDKLVMNRMSKMDIETFDNPKNADKIDAALNSTWVISNAAYWPVEAISYLIKFVSACTIFLAYNYFLGIVFLITYVPGAIIAFRNSKKMDKFSIDSIAETRKKNYYKSLLTEKEYSQDLRIYNLKEYFNNKYCRLWKTIRQKREKIFNKGFILSFASAIISNIGLIFIILYGVVKVAKNEMLLGDLTLFIGMGTVAATTMEYILYNFSSQFRIIIPRMALFIEFLKWKPNITEENGVIVDSFHNLEFQNVFFKYPNSEKYVLNNMSFKINEGESIAIVGINGSGKTTIVKLLLRFYDVTDGKILVNGINIKNIKLSSLHALFSVYFQDLVKYSLTVRENICLSKIDNLLDNEKIYKSIEESGFNEVLKEMNITLDTDLTRAFNDNGIELSGGQWQKLSIARTFFNDSQFIILDEPSSSLDPLAEDRLFNSLIALSKNKTSIIISHRLSNISLVDNILVMDSGKIIEQGNHNSLIKLNGKYSHLYNLQASKYINVGDNNETNN